MKIELKNLKHHPDMSEETECFSASIYYDGRKVGEVRNEGRGGCNWPEWTDKAVMDQFEAWVVTLPPVESGFDKLPELKMNSDLWFSMEVQRIINDRWLRKTAKKGIAIKLDDTPEDEWLIWRGVPATPENLARIKAKYGARIKRILNEELATN